MNRHNVKIHIEKKTISFLSFKGDSKVSSPDQITLPPSMLGWTTNQGYSFGEWLKRKGCDWNYLSEERLCQLGTEFFNSSLHDWEKPRRFDRMIAQPPPEKVTI